MGIEALTIMGGIIIQDEITLTIAMNCRIWWWSAKVVCSRIASNSKEFILAIRNCSGARFYFLATSSLQMPVSVDRSDLGPLHPSSGKSEESDYNISAKIIYAGYLPAFDLDLESCRGIQSCPY